MPSGYVGYGSAGTGGAAGPQGPVTGQGAQTNAPLPGYQSLINQYQSQLPGQLPTIVGAQNQYQQLAGSIPGIMANYGQQAAYTQQEAGLQQQQLGLQGQQLGIQAGALGRQEALDPAQYALQKQGFAQQAKDIASQYAATQANQQTAGVSGGSLFTKGQREAVGQEAEQHQSQLSNLGRAQQSAALTFQEQMAQLQDSKKNLGILEGQLGLSGQEITTRTQNALQQLGLSQMVSVQQVHQAMIDASSGTPNALSSILGNIYQSSGILPLTSSQAGGG